MEALIKTSPAVLWEKKVWLKCSVMLIEIKWKGSAKKEAGSLLW